MKIINNIILALIAVWVLACAEAEQPTQSNMAYGNWIVDEYYVDGQSDGSGILHRFTLERDGSYLLEDNNSVLTVGSWAISNGTLTLTEEGGGAVTYEIVFMTFSKMQLLQSISSPTAGEIQIRYLMNRQSADSY